MGSTCRRNTREFTFVLPPLQRLFYYSLCMLCCLGSFVTPNIKELLESTAKTAQGCSSTERDALLAFKSNIMDPSNRLESWNSRRDCCGWSGVVCRNDTTTANNYLTGSIPRSLGNLSAIISTSRIMSYVSFKKLIGIFDFREESDNITIVTKGFEYSFSKTLSLVKIIDLSNNRLVGKIPEEFGLLAGLQILNLSRNYLKGNIPNTVGGMKSLETLDLSYNILSGVISQGLSVLNSLSHLNLSYNNLSGMIPYRYQLQTLEDPSIYKGNANLCGALINKSCFGDKTSSIIVHEQGGSSLMLSKYLSTTLGFLLGLWCVLIILLFKKDWRNFYFLAIDKVCCEAYVSIKTRLNR